MKVETKPKNVCVFLSSQLKCPDVYKVTVQELGNRLAEEGCRVIYGGTNIGLMGVLADTVVAAHGIVKGIIEQKLYDKGCGHQGLTELVVVNSLQERKRLMIEQADAFICYPGGVGTLDEFFEVVALKYLGYIDKPCGVLNVNGYYDDLIELCRNMFYDKFLRFSPDTLFIASESVDELLATLLLI